MAKKRKTTKKPKQKVKIIKKKSKAVKKTKKRLSRANPQKIGLVIKNLILFVIMTIASTLIFSVTKADTIPNNLFFLLSIIFGFISLAFLIVLLILLIMRGLKK